MQLKPLSQGKLQGWMAYQLRYINFYLMYSNFNHSYKNCKLSGSQQEGLISLLLKQDPVGKYKDPIHLKNWRPFRLQCCDVKDLYRLVSHPRDG